MAEVQREEITARIQKARIEAGLTQAELAGLLDVTPRTYQNYESHRVPWNLINQIAKATGKTSEWLIHGDPEPTPDLMSAFGNGDRMARIEAKLDEILSRLSALELDPEDRAASAHEAKRLLEAERGGEDQAEDDEQTG